jgi:hypothetical protein
MQEKGGLEMIRATTYRVALEGLLGIKYDETAQIKLLAIEREGYTERGICYAISKDQEKLKRFKRDSRFWGMLRNSVRLHCWKKNDPRWQVIEQQKKAREAERERIVQRIVAAEQARSRVTGDCVYFIQGMKGGPIKIGHSRDVEKRIKELQTGFPTKLIVLALLPGSRSTEASLHRRFKKYRLHGEWFSPAPELLEYIRSVNTGSQVMSMG